MSTKLALPTFEEITRPGAPATFGRIVPTAAPIEPPQGQCRITASPIQTWLMQLGESNPDLCNHIIAGGKGLSGEERSKYLRQAHAKYLLEQERAVLDERLAGVNSWRG